MIIGDKQSIPAPMPPPRAVFDALYAFGYRSTALHGRPEARVGLPFPLFTKNATEPKCATYRGTEAAGKSANTNHEVAQNTT